MNEFNFHNVTKMDNESKAGFGIMFFKESGKYHDEVYCTADVSDSDNVDSYMLNEAVRKYVANYGRYNDANAVIIPGGNSIVIPHLISADERR